MKTSRRIICIIMLFGILSMIGCSGENKVEITPIPTFAPSPTPDNSMPKVGFVYYTKDSGDPMTQAHERARISLEKLGYECVSLYSDENINLVKEFQTLYTQDVRVIFLMSTGMQAAADEYKTRNLGDITFFTYGATWPADNVVGYNIKLYQAYYLGGIAMTSLSKTKIAGFIAPNSDTQTMRCINAFALGMKSVDNNARVMLSWTNSNSDSQLIEDAFFDLLAGGCDVITHMQWDIGVEIIAQNNDIYYMSFADKNIAGVRDEHFVMAPKIDLTPYFKEMLLTVTHSYVDYSHVNSLGISDEVLSITGINAMVDDNSLNLIMDKCAQMKNETWDVFTGPIYGEFGLVVGDGVPLPDEDIASMMWLVDNVIGVIPVG